MTDRAALIGAVNAVHYNTDGNITGDNTDAYGFIENIKHVEPNWDPRDQLWCLVLENTLEQLFGLVVRRCHRNGLANRTKPSNSFE